MSKRTIIYEDLRKYGYLDDTPLISRSAQAVSYFDNKFSAIDIDTDQIDSTIEKSVSESMSSIEKELHHIDHHIGKAKCEIIENMPHICTCKLATKEDIQEAKCEIMGTIKQAEEDVEAFMLENFTDLNDDISSDKE